MFALKAIRPKIWHLHFDKSYDLCLHFLRFQEMYEGEGTKNSKIQLVDIMEHYSLKQGNGVFTYPKDWAGFNLPGKDIFKVHEGGISDKNRYDDMMLAIATFIRAKEGNDDFYIIGTSEEDSEKEITFNHELAHGYFYADDKYREKMTKLVAELPAAVRGKINQQLKVWGYDKDVYIDETQAYMSTGLQDGLEKPSIKLHQKKFENVFKSFSRGLRKRTRKTK